MKRLIPIFTLLVVAPALAELLLGDIPFSLTVIPTYILDVALYGSGAVIIREIARRRGLVWKDILLLAAIFGLVEEGLATQSLFNPHFSGLGSGIFGSVWGVNWVWGLYVLGLHTIWSITIPILITEMIFPSRRKEHWLGKLGMWTLGILYGIALVSVYLIYFGLTNFMANPILLGITFIIVVVLFRLAWKKPHIVSTTTAVKSSIVPPSSFIVMGATFFMGAIFFGVHELFPSVFSVPWMLPIIIDLLVFTAAILFIRDLSLRSKWGDSHYIALVSGAILNTILFGFFVAGGRSADIWFHSVLGFIALLLLFLLNKQLQLKSKKVLLI